MKDRFRATFEDEVPADFEDKWSQVWNEQILKLHTGGLTLKDSLDDEAHPFRIIPGRLAITATLLSTLVDIFQALALFAIVLYLNHVIELVNAVQIGSLLIFVLSLLVFLHHSFQLNEYALQPAPGLPQSIQDQFKEQFKLFEARRVIAKQVTVDRTYLSAVRRYFMRFLIMTFYNSLNTLILVGVMVLIGLIGFPAQHDPLLAWYGALAIGVVILPFAVLIGFYLTFLLLQSFGKIMAPVVAALLGALLPFGVEFIVTGQVDWSKAQNALAAAVSGATALIITAITSQVRGKLEASG
jgi:hypothetical protein